MHLSKFQVRVNNRKCMAQELSVVLERTYLSKVLRNAYLISLTN